MALIGRFKLLIGALKFKEWLRFNLTQNGKKKFNQVEKCIVDQFDSSEPFQLGRADLPNDVTKTLHSQNLIQLNKLQL